jgi:glycosyltransferase involved in cell wall biosynthesis
VRVAYTLEQCWHRVPGGTAIAALETARALLAAEIELAAGFEWAAGVELVGVSAWHRRAPLAQFRPPVPVRAVPLPRRAMYEAWLRLQRPGVERTTGAVEVVHATTLIVPPSRAPLVVTVHDLAFVHQPSDFTRHGVGAFERGLAIARDRAAVVLCSSLATFADCRAQGIAVDRLRHVPLGVNAMIATTADVSAARTRYGLPERYLLFAGTLEPRKNLPALLAAVEGLSDPIVLAVAGPPGWGDEIAPLADRLGDRVRLVGYVPDDDLRALYAGCTVFCYPSRREGFGLPVLEAMVQGAAVVTSRGTSTEEVAGDAAVLVDPFDVDDITRGIEEAIDRHDELSARAHLQAARYSWTATAELTVAAYRDALAS